MEEAQQRHHWHHHHHRHHWHHHYHHHHRAGGVVLRHAGTHRDPAAGHTQPGQQHQPAIPTKAYRSGPYRSRIESETRPAESTAVPHPFASPFAASSAQTERPITITNDHGGNVQEYIARMNSYGDRPVQIAGTCNSACTLALSLPNVCVTRNASVGFHDAYYAQRGPHGEKIISQEVSSQLLASYPRGVQNALGNHLTVDMRRLSGSQLIASGVPECGSPRSTREASHYTGRREKSMGASRRPVVGQF